MIFDPELFKNAIRLTGLNDNEVCKLFGISKCTLDRWRDGINKPHWAMTPVIYRVLLEKLTEEAKEMKDEK